MFMENTKLSGKDNINPFNLSYKEAVERILRHSSADDNAIGYYLPKFITTPLPHSEPDLPHNLYERVNGNYIMNLVGNPKYGFPHSGKARLIIAWIVTQLFKKHHTLKKSGKDMAEVNFQAKEVFRGSIKQMLDSMGYASKGGQNGQITLVKKQLMAIIKSHYEWEKKNSTTGDYEGEAGFLFTDKTKIAWRESRWDEITSYIELNPSIYQYILGKRSGFAPFPIDLRAFTALRKSPMAMDLYCWLTKKMYKILGSDKRHQCFTCKEKHHPFSIPWKALYPQFGASYSRQIDFSNAAKRELKRIKLLWRNRSYHDQESGLTYKGLNYRTPRGRILLDPSPTHIPLDAPKSNFYEVINA
jgi:hypothetical protein